MHIFFSGSYLPIKVPVFESKSYNIRVSPLKYKTQWYLLMTELVKI